MNRIFHALFNPKTNSLSITNDGGQESTWYCITFTGPDHIETSDGTKWYRSLYPEREYADLGSQLNVVLRPSGCENLLDAAKRLLKRAEDAEEKHNEDWRLLHEAVGFGDGTGSRLMYGALIDVVKETYAALSPIGSEGMIVAAKRLRKDIEFCVHNTIKAAALLELKPNETLVQGIERWISERPDTATDREQKLQDDNQAYSDQLDLKEAEITDLKSELSQRRNAMRSLCNVLGVRSSETIVDIVQNLKTDSELLETRNQQIETRNQQIETLQEQLQLLKGPQYTIDWERYKYLIRWLNEANLPKSVDSEFRQALEARCDKKLVERNVDLVNQVKDLKSKIAVAATSLVIDV